MVDGSNESEARGVAERLRPKPLVASGLSEKAMVDGSKDSELRFAGGGAAQTRLSSRLARVSMEERGCTTLVEFEAAEDGTYKLSKLGSKSIDLVGAYTGCNIHRG